MSRFIAIFVSVMVLMSVSVSLGQEFLHPRYHTYQEVLDTLADLGNSFSEILYVDTMGYSTRDSLPMLRVKISDNPRVDEDEPAIFYNGGVHADEVLSVEVMTNFIQDILNRYSDNDSAVIRYINELEIFCIPFINPEGHTVVENGDLDWRKNKCDNDSNGVFDFHDGVDNNRNYDFGWIIDDDATANTPESLEYKGVAPFTEAENRAMSAFGWKYRPLVVLDYHSPTYGRPNVAYYPWYWYSSDGGHGFAPDEGLMQSICESFCNLILAVPDTTGNPNGMYETRRALVNKGDLKTYFYGNFGSVAFTVEISDTTIQDHHLVDSIVTAHLPGQYYLLDRALGPGITGVIRDSITLEPLEAEVQVTEHINADINPRLSRPDFGRYRRILAPGNYTLRFIKDGYRTKAVNNVVVGSSGPTSTDVLLYPFNPRPPAPDLIYPGSSDTVRVDTFSFQWDEPVYADYYLLEVSSEPNFIDYVILDSSLADPEYEVMSLLENGIYYWRVKAGNDNGWGPYSVTYDFVLRAATIVSEAGILPDKFELYQNYPNPFNASTMFTFDIPNEAKVMLEIFDITGALVARPVNQYFPAGRHSFVWKGEDSSGKPLASGTYLYRLKTDDSRKARKLVLLK